MKKSIYWMILSFICGMLLIGCSEKEGTAMNVYYVNADGNALVQEEYYRTVENGEDAVVEVLEAMTSPKDTRECQSALPGKIKVESFNVKNRKIELVFNEEYLKLSKSTEVLLRAAVVQTLVQIPDISFVSFYIGDEALKDSKEKVIGMMGAEDFVQNTGSTLKSFQTTDLKLYYANNDGTMLSIEKRSDVRYSINTSIEKLVVEKLMKGTSSDKRSGTIPSNVKLLGVSVKEGICYVNFDSSFLSGGLNQKPEVTIYSIVNSIIVNGNATKVQILVEGSNDIVFMNTIDLRVPLEWKADLIEE